ncbi:MAG: LysM peptidoglycan-binding domain-containing protein [Candidatus Villigracilaceae bacterium]
MNPEPLTPSQAEIARRLEETARTINPNPAFLNDLENKLKMAHKPKTALSLPRRQEIFATLGWSAALLALIFVLTWIIRSLAPQPQPAAGENTPTPSAPAPIIATAVGVPPSAETYDWHGTPLILQTNLPNGPASAFVFNYQPPPPVSLEQARAFAAQLGLNGAAYGNPGAYLIVDGDQRLSISAEGRFEYYPDYPRYPAWARLGNSPATMPENAEELIRQFLQSHGFTFDYVIRPSGVFGGYYVLPLTPDGYPICHESFRCAGLLITLDEQGILSVEGSLLSYAPVEAGKTYEVISAEEALQVILAANGQAGMMEGMTSSGLTPTWYRSYPPEQTVTYYGWLTTIPSAEGGAPLVMLDGFPLTGNIASLTKGNEGFVSARGRFRTQNGGQVFELESYQPLNGFVDGLQGTILQRADGRVSLETAEDETLFLPDIPASLPLPLENAFVLGVRQGEIFDWKSIDLRMTHGGGGGGGGLGFYRLNLTGTPVPFPTPQPAPQFGGGGGGSEGGQPYTVQAGDTLSKIAEQFGVTQEALIQANGLSDPSMLQIGQELVIPSEASFPPQRVEGLRGTLSITIYHQADGSQRVEYGFLSSLAYPSLPLEGENLEALQAYQYRPIDVWGTVETTPQGQPVLKVERYEIPFPDLKFQILHGSQQSVTLEGQPATLFTTKDGATYVQMSPDGLWVDGSTAGLPGDEIAIEALLVPGETFGGYPAARIFAASMVPQGGPTHELPITADQIPTYDEPQPGDFTPPTAVIERVELIYYLPDPNGSIDLSDPDAGYIQPAWMFSGHYEDGTEFFILVQALKQEFLLPETAPFTAPG